MHYRLFVYTYKSNNKYRQFIGTYNGLLEFERHDVEYVVKMRSDQYVDLRKLTDSFMKQVQKAKRPTEIIGVPFFHPATYMLHDFYFVSSLIAMKKFCEAVLAYDMFEFIDSVHREMVLKHAYTCYRGDIRVPDWAYFPYSPPNGVSTATKKIFQYMFENVYVSLGGEVLRSIVWRGSAFSEEYLRPRLLAQHILPKRFSILPLICIDWGRYFYFFQKQGRTILLRDKIITVIGRFSWKFWQFMRRVKTATSNYKIS